MPVLGKEGYPGIVHEDDVERARLGLAGVGRLLEHVVVGRLDDLDLRAFQLGIVGGGGPEAVPFAARRHEYRDIGRGGR
jgi:hypothetical protein